MLLNETADAGPCAIMVHFARSLTETAARSSSLAGKL